MKMTRYKLDTGNSGHDEILFGNSVAEVTQDVLNFHEIDQLPEDWTIEEVTEGEIKQQVDGKHNKVCWDTPITKQALDASEIIHTGWIPNRDVADQSGVNVVDYFDQSGRFLGPDQNGIEPTFAEAE